MELKKWSNSVKESFNSSKESVKGMLQRVDETVIDIKEAQMMESLRGLLSGRQDTKAQDMTSIMDILTENIELSKLKFEVYFD